MLSCRCLESGVVAAKYLFGESHRTPISPHDSVAVACQDGVDERGLTAEFGKIVQFGCDSFNISKAVRIAIAEGGRVYLLK